MEKQEDKLNCLLEDALDDLLDDKDAEAVAEDQVTGVKNVNTTGEGTSLGVVKKQQGAGDKKSPKGTGSKANAGRKNKSKKSSNVTSAPKASQSGMIDEDEMNRFFESMTAQLNDIRIDPEEAREEINKSVPQIFDLMQNLLSKELLYPALTDLMPKFDEWMVKNDSHLSDEDKQRYNDQRNIIKEMIHVFDDESLEASERFERNLNLMERMQSLGSPPSELTVPGGMDKCSIM